MIFRLGSHDNAALLVQDTEIGFILALFDLALVEFSFI